MKIIKTELDGVLVLEPTIYNDNRGFFIESYNKKILKEIGLDFDFVQDNHSRSTKDVLRGLHFQKNHPQGKLVRCVRGSVFDVAVDVNKESPNFGKYFSIELNDINNRMLWIAPGYAHGFCVLSEVADFNYKCTEYYYPNDQAGILWSDNDIGINWPTSNPIISEKDKNYPSLKDI